MKYRRHIRLGNRSDNYRFSRPNNKRPRNSNRVPRYSDFSGHGLDIMLQIDEIKLKTILLKESRDTDLMNSDQGVFLKFDIGNKTPEVISGLENKSYSAEVVAINDTGESISATVFVADDKIDKYLNSLKNKAKKFADDGYSTSNLIDEIDGAAIGEDITSIFTGDSRNLPAPNHITWWELWIDPIKTEYLLDVLRSAEILCGDGIISFPDRNVITVRSSLNDMQRFYRSSYIFELRLFTDNPSLFLDMTAPERREWSADLSDRFKLTKEPEVALLILDGGTNREHILLEQFISEKDWLTYKNSWGKDENSLIPGVRGHGTAMAGLAIYGDLTNPLLSNNIKTVSFCLECIKVLSPQEESVEDTYGSIFLEAINRAESNHKSRKRVICSAITSENVFFYGKPTSWSASIDKAAFGDDDSKRLILLAAGNIRHDIKSKQYSDYAELNREIDSQIEDPAQAWNALTVGAYTEKYDSFIGLRGLDHTADPGDLSPRSRTSFAWSDEWPIKPDIVLEGGNYINDKGYINREPVVSLLTTHYQPGANAFDIFTDTSAATALAANMAADLYSYYPKYLPETIRGLIVHSAEWTPKMKKRSKRTTKAEKVDLLRQFGYGVPNISDAKHSIDNKVTVVAEHSLKPFYKSGNSMELGEIGFHSLPWLEANLDSLENIKLLMKVTLSYFIEPNPSERGYIARYSYPSHGLRFDLKGKNETGAEFRQRINAADRNEDYKSSADRAASARWVLGSKVRQMSGSVYSDWWSGPAIELAQSDQIAVYPVGGWWKSRITTPYVDRMARYSLIISVRTQDPSLAIDLYTPIENVLDLPNILQVDTGN